MVSNVKSQIDNGNNKLSPSLQLVLGGNCRLWLANERWQNLQIYGNFVVFFPSHFRTVAAVGRWDDCKYMNLWINCSVWCRPNLDFWFGFNLLGHQRDTWERNSSMQSYSTSNYDRYELNYVYFQAFICLTVWLCPTINHGNKTLFYRYYQSKNQRVKCQGEIISMIYLPFPKQYVCYVI